MNDIDKLAEELYNWAGRYGSHAGTLWKDARGNKQSEYIAEAKFILNEFIEGQFGYLPVVEVTPEGLTFTQDEIVGLIPAQAFIDYGRAKEVLELVSLATLFKLQQQGKLYREIR